MNILIISTNAIGDAYLSMSAVKPLKKKYKNVHFTFIFPSSAEKLNFDQLSSSEFNYVRKSISSIILILLTKLLFRRYDLAFSFFPGRINSLFLKVCRSSNKGGYYNYSMVNRWDDKVLYPQITINSGKSVGRQWYNKNNFLDLIKNVLQYFIIDFEVEKYKPIPKVEQAIKPCCVTIHSKSKYEDKSLTISQLNTLINFFLERGIDQIYILGTTFDNNYLMTVLENNNVSYLSDLNLEDLVKHLTTSFFVAIDSFPLHIADAYNTEFVGIFSNTKPEAVLVNSNKSINFKRNSFSDISQEEFRNGLNLIGEKIKI